MGQNKAQKQAEERAAKKATTPAQQAEVKQEEVKANGKATTATPAPNKQDQTIEQLKAGWAAKGVNLSKLTIKDDGKFKLLIVDAGWPTVRIGNSGGITVVELKSYAKSFDAAMNGLNLFQKQQAREAKKIAAATVQPAVTKSAPAAEPVKIKAKAAA
jgi:hypothetical protein